MGKNRVEVEGSLAFCLRVVLVVFAVPFFIEVYENISSGIAYPNRRDFYFALEENPRGFWLQTARQFAIGFFMLWTAFWLIKVKEDKDDEDSTQMHN